MKSASWVVVDRKTRRAVLETFSQRVAGAINLNKYAVFPILEYLQRLSRSVRDGETDGSIAL